jgi:hypothetical protein
VSTVLPLGRFVVSETQVSLVNECSALKRMIGAFLPKIAASNAAQLSINQGNQLFSCVLIAVPPVEEQFADPFGRRRAHFSAPIRA